MTEDGDGASVPPPPDADGVSTEKPKLTKAERLEAKAARLRAAEERRAALPDQAQRPTPVGFVVAIAILSTVSAVLLALLVIVLLDRQDLKDANKARAAALNAAKTFALDFGSYDYQHLDADFREVATRMTPQFAKSYTDTSTRLKPTFEQYQTQVTARIQGYGVTTATTLGATVVVFLDQTVRTTQSKTPRIDRNRLEIHLVHTKGKWLVAKLLAK
jgi:Mce-associated membrane protein